MHIVFCIMPPEVATTLAAEKKTTPPLPLCLSFLADAGSKRQPLPSPQRKKERKMVTTSVKNVQRVACTRGCDEGPAMWGDGGPYPFVG